MKSLCSALVVIFLSVAASAQQPLPPEPRTPALLLGAAWYPEQWPESRWDADLALMEHAQNVIVADGAFEWDDLGAWPALARHVKQDAEGNAAVADFIHVDAARMACSSQSS